MTLMKLVVELDYDLNGVPVEDIVSLLNRSIKHLASNGMLSGDTEAEVVEWDSWVEVG